MVSAAHRATTVLTRVWLIEADAGLRLRASAGGPIGGGSYSRVDGEFSRIAIGDGKIGRIAATNRPLIVRDLRGDEDWLSNPGWIARQGVRAFAGLPLATGGEVVGVMAVFSRTMLADADIDAMQLLADVAAARLVSLARTSAVRPDLLTRPQMRELEKRSIEAALAETRGKVFGPGGAAALLQMKPTTLASRVKTLGIRATAVD